MSRSTAGPTSLRSFSVRVHNPGREVRFPGKFPVPGTVRDTFTGPVFWLPGFQIQKSKSQIFWSKTNPGITVAVMWTLFSVHGLLHWVVVGPSDTITPTREQMTHGREGEKMQKRHARTPCESLVCINFLFKSGSGWRVHWLVEPYSPLRRRQNLQKSYC